VLAELAQMKRGEAWVWSPEIDFGPKRIVPDVQDLRLVQAAPTRRPEKLKGWASVDLDDVRAKLATVVEEAKANDPTVLAQCDGSATKSKIAVITGYASTGGGFNNALSALRSKGYINGSDPIALTDEGSNAIGSVPPLPEGDELLDHWIRQLGKAEGAALKVIYEAYPNYLSKELVADATGYEASGGGFNNALSRLRTLELIQGRGQLKASEAFFS
jgi:hypothetical protein